MPCFPNLPLLRDAWVIPRLIVLLTALLIAGPPAWAAPPINTLTPSPEADGEPLPGGLAIRGYDPVAYFTDGRPVPGSARHALDWRGATWHFASAEHRAQFAAEPERYAPQYGGYCAYGVAAGALVEIDPHQWFIHDGKLYLNYDAKIASKWRRDPASYIRRADSAFDVLLQR